MIATRQHWTTVAALITFLFTNSCAPPADIELPTPEELANALSHLIMHSDVTCDELRTSFDVEYLPIVETPDEIGLAYEEHQVPTDDGQLLRVWYLPTSLDRGTVVMSQGCVGPMECYLFVTRMLVHNGWSVVIYDYRGFGGSSGEPDINSLHADLTAVVEWTVEYTGREMLTLLGVSIGAIPSVIVAIDRPDLVNGVILDSPVALGREIQRFEFTLGEQTQAFIDQLAPELLAEELIAEMEQPLLVFQSGVDTITLPESVQLFYDRAAGPKELITFTYLGHASGPYHDTGTYTYYLETFLSKLWRQYTPLTVEISESESE